MESIIIPTGASEREIAIRKRVHRLAEFYRHLVSYVIVNLVLWVVNAAFIYFGDLPNRWYMWWAVWVTLGWGIGVLCHAVTVLPFWTLFSDEWEERKVRELMDRRK